jgi:hypothetical protein
MIQEHQMENEDDGDEEERFAEEAKRENMVFGAMKSSAPKKKKSD